MSPRRGRASAVAVSLCLRPRLGDRVPSLQGKSPLAPTKYQNQSDSFGFVVFCRALRDLKKGEYILSKIFPTKGRRKISGQNLTRRGRASAVVCRCVCDPDWVTESRLCRGKMPISSEASLTAFRAVRRKAVSNEVRNAYTRRKPPYQGIFSSFRFRLKFQILATTLFKKIP